MEFPNSKGVIVVIVVVIVLFILFKNKEASEEREKPIKAIKQILEEICMKLDINVDFEVHSNFGSTFCLNKHDIYLSLRDNNGIPFNNKQLLRNAIHEFAHIISPSEDHEEPFDQIENYLVATALELGYYV
jgi:hypothetical protein